MYCQWSLFVPPVVTICTASGNYMYRQWSLCVPPVVTMCTASSHYMHRQWSLYVPPVVTICTASGHCMYRQWSVYVPPVVTIFTASLIFNSSTFSPHSVFMCFVWIWEQTAIISLYRRTGRQQTNQSTCSDSYYIIINAGGNRKFERKVPRHCPLVPSTNVGSEDGKALGGKEGASVLAVLNRENKLSI
jgi:hypothetical protein